MKKIFITMLVLAFIVSGCSNQRTQNENLSKVDPVSESLDSRFQYEQPFTLDEVKLAFQEAGLTLIDEKAVEPANYVINTVAPAVFSINDSDQTIYIYVFDDISDRKQVVWTGENPATSLPPTFEAVPDGYLTNSYTARNVLIVDLLDLSAVKNIPSYERQVLENLENTVDFLNNSQQIVFMAQSRNWDAQYLVKYYQHWFKDSAGVTHADQYSIGKWSARYTGPNPESVQAVKYSYETPTRSGSGNGIYKKDENCYYFNGQEGSSSYPVDNGSHALTITWDGQEETLDLKPVRTNRDGSRVRSTGCVFPG